MDFRSTPQRPRPEPASERWRAGWKPCSAGRRWRTFRNCVWSVRCIFSRPRITVSMKSPDALDTKMGFPYGICCAVASRWESRRSAGILERPNTHCIFGIGEQHSIPRTEPTDSSVLLSMNAPSDSADSTPLVLLQREHGVAHLTLNRPAQFNALSEQMLTALHGALDAIADERAVRVVVLGGAGKAFCAGHDLKQMKANPTLAYYQRLFDDCSRLMMRIQRLPQPVIARVHGIATAAGCQLVATCDLAIAADDARFAVSGVNVGLFCATPSVALTRNVGRKAAFEMLVTGEFIDAAAAVQRGLINRCVPADRLDQEIDKLTASIVAKPRSVIAAGKALFYRQLELGVAPAYQLAGQSMACNMMEAVAQEGVAAFIERRAPNWSGEGSAESGPGG